MKRYFLYLVILVLSSMLLGQNAYYLNEQFTNGDWSLPKGWVTDSWVQSDFQNQDNLVLMLEVGEWATMKYAITPEIGVIVEGTELEVVFRVTRGWGDDTEGVALNDDNKFFIVAGSIMEDVEAEGASVEWRTVKIPLTEIVGEFVNITFVATTDDDTNFAVSLNSVKVYYPQVENDLHAHSIIGFPMPTHRFPTSHDIRVVNMGTAAANNFNVKLMQVVEDGSDLQIGIITGLNLSVNETMDVKIEWTPMVEGDVEIYGIVEYEADTVQNNVTDYYPLEIQPNGTLLTLVGDPDSNVWSPELMPGVAATVIQTIYFAEDIGLSGEITRLGYIFDSFGDFKDIPVRIFFAVTNKMSFSDANIDWIPFSDFTLVYEGELTVEEEGIDLIMFDLKAPFEYSTEDGNLVVMFQRRFYDENFYWSNTFLSTMGEDHHFHSLRTYSFEEDVDIENLPTDWSAMVNNLYTNMLLTFTVEPMSGKEVYVMPGVFTLEQNYPNPFNPSTTITFENKVAGNVEISVYNLRGQRVKSLANDNFTAGVHKVEWNGTDDNGREVASGVYFYQMKVGDMAVTKRMVMMK